MKKITKLFLTSVVLLMMITGFATITSAEILSKGTPMKILRKNLSYKGCQQNYIKDLFKTFSKS